MLNIDIEKKKKKKRKKKFPPLRPFGNVANLPCYQNGNVADLPHHQNW
jgi:hypothetical protein